MPSSESLEDSVLRKVTCNLALPGHHVHNMSFTEICDRFAAVTDQLVQSSLTVRSLAGYFKALRKGLDGFVQGLDKAGTQLSADLAKTTPADTLLAALTAFQAGQKQVLEQVSVTAG